MSVILKYFINFPDAGFSVSNDFALGDFLADVSVEVVMRPTTAGTSFTIQIFDLPQDKAKLLREDPKGAHVVIKLGYFEDTAFHTVVQGVYTQVETKTSSDSAVTTIKGEEEATLGLRHAIFNAELDGKIRLKSLVEKILTNVFPDEKDAGLGSGSVLAAALSSLADSASGGPFDKTPVIQNVNDEFDAPSFRGKSVMDVLDALADRTYAEFVVCDKKIRIDKPIKNDDYEPAGFDRNVNLAEFSPYQKILLKTTDANGKRLPEREVHGFNFRIAGDAQLRPGNRVFADLDGYMKKDQPFRVHSLVHRLTMTGGYVCEGLAVAQCSDENCRRQQKSVGQYNVESVTGQLSEKIKSETNRHPTVEICAVKSHTSGQESNNPHRATLQFGQRFEKSESQPSLRAAVEDEATQLFSNKPIVASFAWHKCGQVIPVYPGMKAVVAHNLGLTDDGLVTGFIWSETPAIAPPKSQPGDWWLCLPVNFDGTTPTDTTNAANDLIANNGHRVIEVSGLRITTGKSTLGTVGVRPTESKDDDILIEHKPSGSAFHIDPDGAVTITGKSGTSIRLDSSGGLTIECKGDLTMKADGAIKIQGTTIDLN